MQIKLSKKKEELRKDPFIDSIVVARSFVEKNVNVLVTVLVAAIFVFIFVLVYRSIQRSNELSAQKAFGLAMTAYGTNQRQRAIESFTIVIDNHKNTKYAAYSAYILGTILIDQGKYGEALGWLETAVSNKRDIGFIGPAVFEALGDAHEGNGNLEQALEYYRKALDDKRIYYRIPHVWWKMALLQKELNQFDSVREHCMRIISDTLAADYHTKAKNLLSELRVSQVPIN